MLPLRRFAAATIAVLTLATPTVAQDWSRFRGPNGTGVSESANLPVEFGSEKNLEWETELPFARSSPVLAGDRIFVTAVDADTFTTLAVDRSSGKELWRQEIGRDRQTEMYKGNDSATPSPVTDGASVYAFFQETGLVAYTVSGEERWSLALGPFRNFYGIAASPVLAGNTLLLLCDQAMGSFLLAVDTDSGKELWRQGRPARLEGYTTPILYPGPAKPSQVLVFGSKWVDAYEIGTGKSVWTLGGVGAGPVASPVFAGDILLINAPDHAAEPPPPFSELTEKHDANGDGRLEKSEVAETWMVNHFGWVDVDGDGYLSAEDWATLNEMSVSEGWGVFAIRVPENQGQPEILWNNQQSVPYIPSPLVYDGVLYMVKDGIVSSLDPKTGALHKRGRLTKGSPKVYASPVAADGKIYIGTLEGQMAVLQAGEQWEVLALNDLEDEIYASPAIADGHLYVRTRGKLLSFAAPEKVEDSTSP